MSTKLNARSPFYLTLSEPTVPTIAYDCIVAGLKDSGGNTVARNLEVNQQGVVTEPDLDQGTILSFTSSAGDFANGKFATVTSATSRTIVFTISIPSGYSNSADGIFSCSLVTSQIATPGNDSQPACTGGITNNGSISQQNLNTTSSPVELTLASFFNGTPTKYIITNNNPNFITTSTTGTGNAEKLLLTPNSIAGTRSISVEGRDASFPTSCSSVQNFDVVITKVGDAMKCTTGTNEVAVDITGGSMTAAGVLTVPTSSAKITVVKKADGTVLATGTTDRRNTDVSGFPVNSTGSDRTVSVGLTFVVPAGFTNAGADIVCTNFSFTQFAGLPTFNCDIAALTEQSINKNGAIFAGQSALGTIQGFTPFEFPEVSTATPRTGNDAPVFTVRIPSGYSNTGDGSQDITCPIDLTQPPINIEIPQTGVNEFKYFLSGAKNTTNDFCNGTYGTFTEVTSKANTSGSASLESLDTAQIYQNGTPFIGGFFYYAVTTSAQSSAAGLITDGSGNALSYYVVQIDNNGIVLELRRQACDGATERGGIL